MDLQLIKSFKLFIDDERYPVEDDWIIARNINDVKIIIEEYGFPSYISFDHDLGDNQPSGFDIAKYLVEYMMNNEVAMFEYYVHSQNPIGKENIEGYLSNFQRVYYGEEK